MTQPYEPSEEEIEALRGNLEHSRWFPQDDYRYRLLAMWILFRYEPRTQGQRCDGSGKLWGAWPGTVEPVLCPSCPACTPKATPKGDGCKVSGCLNRVVLEVSDGPHGLSPRTNIYRACEEHKGQIDVFGFENVQRFSSGSHTSDGVSTAGERGSTQLRGESLVGPAAPITSIEQRLDDKWTEGYQAGREDAAHLEADVRTIELGPRTTRALVAAQMFATGNYNVRDIPAEIDTLLAELAKKEK